MGLEGKKVLVVGMAKSGIASARLLLDKGAEVILYDAKKLEKFAPHTFDEFEGKAEFAFGVDPNSFEYDAMVLSPGVPTALEFIQEAVKQGKKVIGEQELGFIYTDAEFVAITGTNGKTTTTVLTGEVFKNAEISTHVLGNMGIPIAGEVQNTNKGDVIVAETAALQLEMIDEFCPHVSAVLNITEDHLDRFGTMECYIAAKKRVFENQTEDDFCVLNYDNDVTRAMAGEQKSRVIFFSRKEELDKGVFVKDDFIVSVEDDGIHTICRADEVRIPGVHNLENALAATAIARCYDISEDVIARTLEEFDGVEHRIEFVREFAGIRYINDSKGTNPDATINAAKAMDRPTVIILGGSQKNNSFVELFECFGENIKSVVAIGETQGNILKDAETVGYKNIYTAGSFEEAVLKARDLAQDGWNVLLSPACASYDMFDNFEQRGEAFKNTVRSF